MLVLTRKANEQIQIGDQVVVTILRIKGQSVRIGIEAPRDVLVLRSELPKNEQPDTKPPVRPAPTDARTRIARSNSRMRAGQRVSSRLSEMRPTRQAPNEAARITYRATAPVSVAARWTT